MVSEQLPGKKNNRHVNHWPHSGMTSYKEITRKLEAPIIDKTDSPTTLFKKLFTDDIL